jgi:hypothetical protein
MASYFRIRNFERFQHYKDRNPPWIRLYGALWRDRAFFRLPDALKAHLIGLFALAARLDNRIPNDPEWLAHELCASEPIDLSALVASGFLIPEHQASTAIATRNHYVPSSVSGSELPGVQVDLPFKDRGEPVAGRTNTRRLNLLRHQNPNPVAPIPYTMWSPWGADPDSNRAPLSGQPALRSMMRCAASRWLWKSILSVNSRPGATTAPRMIAVMRTGARPGAAGAVMRCALPAATPRGRARHRPKP